MIISAGQKAPDFTLVSSNGEEITLSEALQEGPVALVFFPLAFSGICTGELCEIRDNLEIFNNKKVRLFGISVDSKFALKAWADEENYSFDLLADFWPHGEVAKKYGVFVEDAGIASRATFLIGTDGTVLTSFVNPPGQARDFSEYTEALKLI